MVTQILHCTLHDTSHYITLYATLYCTLLYTAHYITDYITLCTTLHYTLNSSLEHTTQECTHYSTRTLLPPPHSCWVGRELYPNTAFLAIAAFENLSAKQYYCSYYIEQNFCQHLYFLIVGKSTDWPTAAEHTAIRQFIHYNIYYHFKIIFSICCWSVFFFSFHWIGPYANSVRILVSEFPILAQKWSKIAPRKKVEFWLCANHPAVHIVGASRGRFRGCGYWR